MTSLAVVTSTKVESGWGTIELWWTSCSKVAGSSKIGFKALAFGRILALLLLRTLLLLFGERFDRLLRTATSLSRRRGVDGGCIMIGAWCRTMMEGSTNDVKTSWVWFSACVVIVVDTVEIVVVVVWVAIIVEDGVDNLRTSYSSEINGNYSFCWHWNTIQFDYYVIQKSSGLSLFGNSAITCLLITWSVSH